MNDESKNDCGFNKLPNKILARYCCRLKDEK